MKKREHQEVFYWRIFIYSTVRMSIWIDTKSHRVNTGRYDWYPERISSAEQKVMMWILEEMPDINPELGIFPMLHERLFKFVRGI